MPQDDHEAIRVSREDGVHDNLIFRDVRCRARPRLARPHGHWCGGVCDRRTRCMRLGTPRAAARTGAPMTWLWLRGFWLHSLTAIKMHRESVVVRSTRKKKQRTLSLVRE
jgi:hypothetical protein